MKRDAGPFAGFAFGFGDAARKFAHTRGRLSPVARQRDCPRAPCCVRRRLPISLIPCACKLFEWREDQVSMSGRGARSDVTRVSATYTRTQR
mmetsp:Transcript_76134/g.210062  ORF Transcript_76134/g.210062 Transcript_76134/m.210062 type:complete len:92 (+) Transcript_76134:91-366(+)